MEIINFSNTKALIDFHAKIASFNIQSRGKVGVGYDIMIWGLPITVGVGFLIGWLRPH